MSKIKMFSPFDSKLKVWMNPLLFTHVGQAERAWGDIVNDSTSIISKHPGDFTLYQIGEFDSETGAVEPCTPHQVMTALAAKQQPQEAIPLEARRK